VKSIYCCPLTQDDLPAALLLDQRCLGGLWSEAGYRREMDSPNSDLWILKGDRPIPEAGIPEAGIPETGIPETGNNPVIGLGCYWAILEEAHITLLAIAPEVRRSGLGRWLLTQLLHQAQQRGLERATLEVRASNTAALKLYKNLGFRIAGRRRGYYDDGEDALILWQSGLQTGALAQQLQGWPQTGLNRLREQGWQCRDVQAQAPSSDKIVAP
jgi:ribosomal-protein-alanine N-acetyltransferase